MKLLISSLFIILLGSGCSTLSFADKQSHLDYKSEIVTDVRNADYTEDYADTSRIYQNLNGVIVAIADQLLVTNLEKDNKIMLTSFVDLNQLNKTTTFGRLVSESMFNELHIRKFKVSDIRGQDAVSINADGEFHLTRDIKKLKKHITGINYILVGTYTSFENESVLVNARILDSENGDVISSARIIYKPRDCKLFDICGKPAGNGIDIVTDYCSQVSCPNQDCKSGTCDSSPSY